MAVLGSVADRQILPDEPGRRGQQVAGLPKTGPSVSSPMRTLDQPCHLLAAQQHGEPAQMRQPDEAARQIRAVERVSEEEAKRRHDAVHGWHRNAVLLLLDLEPAQIVGRRCVR